MDGLQVVEEGVHIHHHLLQDLEAAGRLDELGVEAQGLADRAHKTGYPPLADASSQAARAAAEQAAVEKAATEKAAMEAAAATVKTPAPEIQPPAVAVNPPSTVPEVVAETPGNPAVKTGGESATLPDVNADFDPAKAITLDAKLERAQLK